MRNLTIVIKISHWTVDGFALAFVALAAAGTALLIMGVNSL